MAEYILPPNKDKDLSDQFKEILFGGITRENIDEDETFVLTSPNGTEYRLIVDDTGSLSTEEVE